MREEFKDFQEGDVLGANHSNKWNKIARIVAGQQPGAFQTGNENGTTGLLPYVQRVVTVVAEEESSDSFSSSSLSSFSSVSSSSKSASESESSSKSSSSSSSVSGPIFGPEEYEVRPMYWDEDNNVWRVNYDEGPYDLDISVYGEAALALVGDVLVAFYDPQRDAFVPTDLPMIREGTLDEPLVAATRALRTPGKASMSVYTRNQGSGQDQLEFSGKRIIVVNRMTELDTISAGTWIRVQFLNQEWVPIASDCDKTTL